ncbi:FAD/NAD(P)-binding domain-containing protein [Ramaria rubella]|nr:FAD/NAD(P)-binding domain-containing protein [Ramaria rubella]
MRVAVIGAGFGGITAGIRIPQRLRNVELVIYERLSGVGGAWRANTYPGLTCDVPSHTYQLGFEPNLNWSSFFPPGPEILAYLEGVADKYKLKQYMRFNHTLTNALWDAKAGKWNLTLSTREGDVHDSVDFVLNCTGPLTDWAWPDIEGLGVFEGSLVHSANWTLKKQGEKEAWEGKTVAVIGVGASAIQLVPAMQPKAAKLTCFVRGKTWIAPPSARDEIQARNPGSTNFEYTEEDKTKFKDPEYYSTYRRKLENDITAHHGASLRGHKLHLMFAPMLRDFMSDVLAKQPEIAKHLIPNFSPGCRRFTPGLPFLEALLRDNVEFVSNEMKCFTPSGIETVDGKERKFDIIVCATGYNTSYIRKGDFVGRDGANLRDKWSAHTTSYMSIATDGFPNWFYVLGPNSGVGAGSIPALIDKQVGYFTSVVAKAQREHIKSIEVKKEAVEDFDEYIENYFPQTIYSEKCRSWFKNGREEGRVTNTWPGSTIHAMRAMENPRWEDYNYEYVENRKNRLYWLGNGWTAAERDETGDRVSYLDEIDYPPVPGSTEPSPP